MDAKSELLTREVGLRDFITPTGRKLDAVPDAQRSLFWIKFVDGKGGQLPQALAGSFTGKYRAEMAIREFITEFWDISDAASKKPKVTSNVTNNAND